MEIISEAIIGCGRKHCGMKTESHLCGFVEHRLGKDCRQLGHHV